MIRQVCNYRDSATVVYIQCRHGELTPTLDFKKKIHNGIHFDMFDLWEL